MGAYLNPTANYFTGATGGYSYTLALGGIVNVGSGITINQDVGYKFFQKTKTGTGIIPLLLWVNRTKSNYRYY